MARDGEEKLLRLRVPVSERFWRDYGVPVAFVAAALVALAFLRADNVGEGLTFAAVFVGLSLGSLLAGLAVYNVVVVIALLASKR